MIERYSFLEASEIQGIKVTRPRETSFCCTETEKECKKDESLLLAMASILEYLPVTTPSRQTCVSMYIYTYMRAWCNN